MCLRKCWTGAVIALAVLNGAAFADVTVSQSNDPTARMGSQFASILGAEKQTRAALPDSRLSAIATGPDQPVEKPAQKRKRGKAVSVAQIRYDDAWLSQFPAQSADPEWQCLRTALYFEARGESLQGQFAVAEVILNRRDSGRYPASICGVVKQGCQFSFTCDGASERMREPGAADRAGRIASAMLSGAPRALTEGATHFHTRAVRPSWANRFARTAAIGAHLFYRQP